MRKKVKKRVPELRFSEFHGDWLTDRTDHFLARHANPVDVQLETAYKQIGIRSHGKGIFHKDSVTGEALGNKRVYWVHPEAFTVNIVFAWEQAVALTSSAEESYIASHRFLMFLPKYNKVDLKFVLLFFLRKRGKYLLELASPGGAGRNKTLGLDSFAELEITLPQREEQEKIAGFLGAVDARLTQLRCKRDRLQTYKRGVMQKIFSQQIRFRGAIGLDFPDWEEKKIGEIAIDGFSNGVFNDPDKVGEGYRLVNVKDMYEGDSINVDFLSRLSLDEKEFRKNQAKYGDIFFTRSSLVKEGIAHSNVLLTNDRDITYDGHLIRLRFDLTKYIPQFIALVLKSSTTRKQLVARGKTGTMTTMGQEDISTVKIEVPSKEEQEKIANFLSAIDQKIEAISRQSDRTEQFKKGLLQKMFV